MNNKISSPKLKKGFKKIRKNITFSIICLLLTIGSGVWLYQVKTGNYESITMKSASLNSSSNNIYAHINANLTPYVFAEYNNTANKYYLVMDKDNSMYIAYLSPNSYNKLENSINNPIKITGITKRIPNDIKTLAINAYNELTGEQILNNNNFENYLGSIYLDTTKQPTDTILQISLVAIFSILTIIFMIIAIIKKNKITKKINNITTEEWKLIEEELDKPNTIYYKDLNLYLTENYVINLTNGINIFSYNNILWMYPYHLKQYGITTTKSLIIITNDKIKHEIANINNFSKKDNEDYDTIMHFIYNKNQKITLGFSKENRKQMKDLYDIE